MAAGDFPDYSVIPNVVVFNPQQVQRAFAEAYAGKAVQICNFDDSQGTFPGGQGLYYQPTMNALLCERFGAPTYSEWIRPTNFASSGAQAALRMGGVSFTSGVRSGDTNTAGTAGFIATAKSLPGWSVETLPPTNAPHRVVGWTNGIMAAVRNRIAGGQYLSISSSTWALRLMSMAWNGTAGIYNGGTEANFEPTGANLPINPTTGNYNSYSGWATTAGYPVASTTALGVTTQPEGTVLTQDFNIGLISGNVHPIFTFYQAVANKVMPYMGSRIFDPAVTPRGVVFSSFGVGGAYFGQMFGPSGQNKDSGPVLRAICANTDNTWLMIGGHTNNFNGANTAALLRDEVIVGVKYLVSELPAAHKTKALIVLNSDEYRSGLASYVEYNQHVGALVAAGQKIAADTGLGVVVLNSYRMFDRLGLNATFENIDITSITAYNAGTGYTQGQRCYIDGSGGREYWESTWGTNTGNLPGSDAALASWRPIKSNLLTANGANDTVHHGPNGGFRKAQIADAALFGGPYSVVDKLAGTTIVSRPITLSAPTLRNRNQA